MLFTNSTYMFNIAYMDKFICSLLMKQSTVRWNYILVIFLFLLISLPVSSETKETRHVLLLNSYHQEMTWVRNITQAVQDALKSNEHDFIFHIENMDTKRHYDDAYLNKLADFYAEKYKHLTLDLILSSDNNAFKFLRKNHRILFPKVPIVFSGVNYFKPAQIIDHPEFTGVSELFSDVDTIKIILQLHPKTKKIFIVNDYTPTGRAWTQTMLDNIAATQLDKQVEISFAENLSFEKLQAQLEKLGDDVVVLLGVYFKDQKGSYLTYERIQQELFKNTTRPIYALLNFNVSDNVMGGKVVSGYSQGEEATKIGLQVLSGIAPIDIPVMVEGVNQYEFNWPQLKKWNINIKLLPRGSKIINRPPSFYDQNKMIVDSIISLIVLLISVVLIQIRKSSLQKVANRKLEKQVAERTKELSMQTKMLEDVGRLSTTGGWELDISTMHLKWSKETYLLYEVPESYEPNVDEVIKFYTLESQPIITDAVKNALNNGTTFDLELPFVTAKGRSLWVRALGEVIYKNGKPETLIGAIQDITERKLMENSLRVSEERLKLAVEAGAIGLWELNLVNHIAWRSLTHGRIFGYEAPLSEWTYEIFLEHVIPEDRADVDGKFQLAISTQSNWDFECRIHLVNGKIRWIWATGEHQLTSAGQALRMAGVVMDITERKEAEEKIRHLAMTDPLTGLANRTQFDLRLQQSMKLANREGKSLALMMVDLDKFKPVNDTFGHPAGDALLQAAASIFIKFTRETDLVVRLGGDEFAILVVHPKAEESVGKNAQRIIDEIKKPITIMGDEIQIGASIGIAFYPKDADNQEGLLKKSDLALYEAKESGRGIFTSYRPDMDL